MYCKNCGTEIEKGAKFCGNCGAPAASPPKTEETERQRQAGMRKGKGRKRRAILFLTVLCLAILAGVFLTVIKPMFFDSREAAVQTKNDVGLKPGETGNTFGNLANGGQLVQSGDWIYYSNGQGIYKTKDMKEEGTQICKATVPGNLNAAGDWIYYTAGRGAEHYNVIYRVRTNGTESEMLSEDPCSALAAAGSKLYYQTVDTGSESDEGYLYSMDMEGNGAEKVMKEKCRFLGIDSGYLYYTVYKGEQNTLCRMKADGEEKEPLIADFHSICIPVIRDGWLYYAKAAGGDAWKLHRKQLAGGKDEEVTDLTASSDYWEIGLNVKDDWIYFVDLEEPSKGDDSEWDEEVSRIKSDGSGREKISRGGWSCAIFTTDEQVLCAFSSNSADELENWSLDWEII